MLDVRARVLYGTDVAVSAAFSVVVGRCRLTP